ncbi:MAG: hypothetical protein K2I43_01610, partial [Alistipes sp.]|nr:hypothetical protein [Alistipes sp.]
RVRFVADEGVECLRAEKTSVCPSALRSGANRRKPPCDAPLRGVRFVRSDAANGRNKSFVAPIENIRHPSATYKRSTFVKTQCSGD